MSRAAFSGFSPLDDSEEFKLASKRTRVPYADIVSSLVNKYLSHRVNWTTLEVACLAFAFQSPWKFVAGDKDIEIEWAMEKGATRLSEAIEKVYPPGITHPLYIEHRKVLDRFGHRTDAAQDINRFDAIAYLLESGVRREALPGFLEQVEQTKANDGLVVNSAPDGWIGITEAAKEIVKQMRPAPKLESIKTKVWRYAENHPHESWGSGKDRRIAPSIVAHIVKELEEKACDEADLNRVGKHALTKRARPRRK